MFQQIMQNASERAALLNGDNYYIGDNGFKYCKKCHTPMQIDVSPYCHFMGIVDCLCECGVRARDARENSSEKERRQRITDRILNAAFQDKAMKNNTFANDKYHLECAEMLKTYCNKFSSMREKGEGLLLFGNYGTGKTYYASCVINKLAEQQYESLFTNFSQLAAKSDYGFDLAEYLNRYSLVVFDDLGVERSSEYMQQIVYNAIDARYRARLPMIITTNVTMAELKHPANAMEQRIYGRILERCFPINFNMEALRMEEIKYNFTAIKTEFDEDLGNERN